jgi:hypothetical protein
MSGRDGIKGKDGNHEFINLPPGGFVASFHQRVSLPRTASWMDNSDLPEMAESDVGSWTDSEDIY